MIRPSTQQQTPAAGRCSVRQTGLNPPARLDRLLAALAAAACIGLLVFKFALTRVQSINWDEFYFLSHVYSLARGELNLFMLGAYTHLFSWLVHVPGDEIGQIAVARCVMTVLLAATAWLVWRLARVWLTGAAALIPPFAYLSASPVLRHGGSFRFDSMLAPLSIAALVLLLAPGRSKRRDWLAGVLLGVAFAVTLKVVLFAPLILIAALFRGGREATARAAEWREGALSLFRITVAAGATAAALLAMHWLSIAPLASDPIVGAAASAARKTLLETPWFPRAGYLQRYVLWQPLMWLFIALGTMLALLRRRFVLASLSLALLPIAFYRNAFPYYYVVMLAPSCILAGYAVQEIYSVAAARSSKVVSSALLMAIWAGLLYQGLAYAQRLYLDDLSVQRAVVAGVHEIFPHPVNYIDRCGMVSSFRQVNFFMSTWGMESYLSRNEPFMPRVLRESKPAFVLVNANALRPNLSGNGGLLPADRQLLDTYYPRYWGPIRVAGSGAQLAGTAAVRMHVPFTADYRLEAPQAVLVDGILRRDGEMIHVDASGVSVRAATTAGSSEPIFVNLFLATAGARPAPIAAAPLFSGL